MHTLAGGVLDICVNSGFRGDVSALRICGYSWNQSRTPATAERDKALKKLLSAVYLLEVDVVCGPQEVSSMCVPSFCRDFTNCFMDSIAERHASLPFQDLLHLSPVIQRFSDSQASCAVIFSWRHVFEPYIRMYIPNNGDFFPQSSYPDWTEETVSKHSLSACGPIAAVRRLRILMIPLSQDGCCCCRV